MKDFSFKSILVIIALIILSVLLWNTSRERNNQLEVIKHDTMAIEAKFGNMQAQLKESKAAIAYLEFKVDFGMIYKALAENNSGTASQLVNQTIAKWEGKLGGFDSESEKKIKEALAGLAALNETLDNKVPEHLKMLGAAFSSL